MDIDAFSQCLNYLGSAQNKKPLLELVIPAASSLMGVIVGASLTMMRERSKEKIALKNKTMCISEELARVKNYLEHITQEAIHIYDSSVAEHVIPGHQLQLEISLPFIVEHFTSIAHKYSQGQRNHIIQFVETIKELNQQLGDFHSLRNPSNFKGNALTSLNIVSAAIHCYQILESIAGNEIKQKKLTLIDLSDKLGIKSPYIENLRRSLDTSTSRA